MTMPATSSATARPLDCAAKVPLWRRPVLWVGLGLVVAIAAVALNWSWLAAAGLLPVLFALLPCGAMCVLPLCSSNKGKPEGKPTEAVQPRSP